MPGGVGVTDIELVITELSREAAWYVRLQVAYFSAAVYQVGWSDAYQSFEYTLPY